MSTHHKRVTRVSTPKTAAGECAPFRARGGRSQGSAAPPPVGAGVLCCALTHARQADYQAAGDPPARSSAGRFGVIAMSNPFLWLISTVIWIYIYILIAAVVMSWLVAFNVVNSHNPTVRMIGNFLYQATE